MTTPQAPQSGNPPAVSSAHQEAATAAAAHLDQAVAALEAAYGHPHHGDRLAAVRAHAATLKGWIERLPSEEDSRADHASRVMTAYRNRQLGPTIPDHDDRALRWELERNGS